MNTFQGIIPDFNLQNKSDSYLQEGAWDQGVTYVRLITMWRDFILGDLSSEQVCLPRRVLLVGI